MSTHKRSSRSTKKSSSNFGVVLLVIAVVIFICVFLDVKTGYDQIDDLIHSVHVSYVEPLLDGETGHAAPTPPTAPTAPVSLQGDESSNLSVQFVDVGQADCILAQYGDSYMLIDAGNNNDGPLLVKYFQELGIEEFEYVICTHAHEDHCGGLDDIFYNFPVKVAFLPYTECDTLTWKHVLDAVEFSEATTLEPHVGVRGYFDHAVRMALSLRHEVLILHGIFDMVDTGQLAAGEVYEFLSNAPDSIEIICTGHTVDKKFLRIADEAVEMLHSDKEI